MTDLTSLGGLTSLAVRTVKEPRPVLAELRAMNLPREVLWQALAAVVLVSVIMAELVNMVLASTMGGPAGQPIVGPLAFVGIQFAILLLSVLLIDRVGRMMGGTGDLDGAIVAVTWLQVVMVCLQVVQSLLLLLVPFVAALVVIGGIALFLFLLTAFVTELHGFRSTGRVFAMILFVLMGVALGLSFVLTLAGVTVPR